MAAGSPRRPRSPAPEKVSSPPVSELSTSDVATGDGSGSIRGYRDDADSYGDDVKSISTTPHPVTVAALAANNADNSDSAVSDDDDGDGEASSVAEYSDSGSERSASDTYYLDMGGEAVVDELGWQDVVKQADIVRTYGSDEEDGGACPDILIESIEKVERQIEPESEEPEVIGIEPTPVVDVDVEEEEDLEEVSPVELLDDANVDVLLDDDEEEEIDLEKEASRVHTLPDDDYDEKRERVDTLLDGQDIDVNSADERAHEIVSRQPVAVAIPKLLSASGSASDDSVVAVDLSDGEEVLADEDDTQLVPSWAKGAEDLTPADLHKALEKTAAPVTPPNAKPVRRRSNCNRRKYLLERLRTVRTALQMVQIETAAKSAEAQLNVVTKSDGHHNEQKSKYKKELAALSATLDFLAKMALQRAIELENKEEGKCGNGNTTNTQ